ncbi:MAG: glycosyltransferase [Opitutaceae bacterium]|nr:glycosyltransferase [Cytophagales bacterium]
MSAMQNDSWALIVPMANEEEKFSDFVSAVQIVLDTVPYGCVYIVMDKASTDKTIILTKELALKDPRFVLLYVPENKNVVDAYLAGYKEAYKNGHSYFIEMDAGMSHNPASIPMVLENLKVGTNCVFGSRFLIDSSTLRVGIKRKVLSRGGTFLSNVFLGSKLSDMTSGYEGFDRQMVGLINQYKFKSTGHFFQTELRYILRNYRYVEFPIHYQDPSSNVSIGSILNSIYTLLYYTRKRIFFDPVQL